jgi:catechol 2,3-dioxygenase-like lactoylglutathione lyase family enzyme
MVTLYPLSRIVAHLSKICHTYLWAKNIAKDFIMTIQTGAVHHLALTVTDTVRSRAFYESVLGFKHLMDLGTKVLMSNGAIVLAINPPPDPEQAIANDHFSEHRVGLDHVSPAGVPIYVLAFRDPDGIQLELTTPKV